MRKRYSLKNMLLKEMAHAPADGSWQEWGAQSADPVPEEYKVWVDWGTHKVALADGTIVSGAAGNDWSNMERAAAHRSMKGYLRQAGGYAKQDWTASVVGAQSGTKGSGDDLTIVGDDGSTTAGEAKGMSGRNLAVPILTGQNVTTANAADHAKTYIQDNGGKIYSGTRQFAENDFDFSKVRIGTYGEGGKLAVNVPLK